MRLFYEYLSGIVPLLLALFSIQVEAGVALLYHHVDDKTPAITSISPSQFDRHLAIIEEEGFSVVPLTTLVTNSLAGHGDAKEVSITFDDAYISIYREAYPRLRSRDWPFTIFVSPAMVSDTNPYYLSWDQIREMSHNGASIQNHGLTHTHMVRRLEGETAEAWKARMTREINDAAGALTDAGFSASQFAYPYGEYNPELLQLVRSLDLQGFGQQSGAIGPESDTGILPRFPLAGVYVGEAAFRDKLRSLAMPVVHPDIDPLIENDLRPPLSLAFIDPAFDSRRLTCYGPGGLMEINRSEPGKVSVTPVRDLPVGRSRYNCTLPRGNRFYWFSQLWLRKKSDGSWYPEP